MPRPSQVSQPRGGRARAASPDLVKPIGSFGRAELVRCYAQRNSFSRLGLISNAYRGAPPERERALNEALEGEAMI